ncbi:AAA family ATPase [Pseudomonas entomophila]|uniref:AAA family ATPase n=1 Tax=Pseudomonas entomophila TaxID=312306 RepID=UPI001F01799D|nr:AAA family ATPase [Pseudomonas entomophila]MCG8294283.1 AAA family ATPase [Pseudomonas entomophila]
MTASTPRSCVVHGPEGCGKTTNAQAIAKALGLPHVLDGWEPGQAAPLINTLILTSARDPSWYFKGRVMTFDQAMLLVGQQEAQA